MDKVNSLLYWTPLANFRCSDPAIGTADVEFALAPFPLAFAAAAGDAPPSWRDANFLNALNIVVRNFHFAITNQTTLQLWFFIALTCFAT